MDGDVNMGEVSSAPVPPMAGSSEVSLATGATKEGMHGWAVLPYHRWPSGIK